jgi:hypothetical protein
MAPKKELLPLIQRLKDWRRAQGFSQYEASRALRDAGIPMTTDSLQAWEIGRSQPARPRRLGPGRVPPTAAQAQARHTIQRTRQVTVLRFRRS